MAEDRGGNGGSVLVAFVLGAIAGAAVALLWAPATGEETRRKLGERARESRDKASEAAAPGARVHQGAARQPVLRVRAGQGSVRSGRGPKEPA